MNKSVRTIKNYMNKMQEKGIIKRENSKKKGQWNVLKKSN
jgi:predicted transcriptional regulator